MSSGEDIPEPGTSAAPQDDNRETPACPECRDISTACSGSCRHCFCRLCLWDWSLGEAMCPRCQRPTRHPYPQHVALYHEVQDRAHGSKQRRRGLSAPRPRSCSGRFGHGRRRESRRGRSVRWPRDGRRRSGRSRGSGSPRRRWWQQGRPWEDTRGEGAAVRFEGDVAASSRGGQARHRARRSRSRREGPRGQRGRSRGRERSHDPDGRRRGSSSRDQDTPAGSHDGFARQRCWRSWNADDRHAPRHDVPSRRSERHQQEGWDSSRQQHTVRRRSRGRSHRRSPESQTSSEGTVPREHSRGQRRWRSWNADQGRAPRSQWDTPGSSGRSRSRAGRRDT